MKLGCLAKFLVVKISIAASCQLMGNTVHTARLRLVGLPSGFSKVGLPSLRLVGAPARLLADPLESS